MGDAGIKQNLKADFEAKREDSNRDLSRNEIEEYFQEVVVACSSD